MKIIRVIALVLVLIAVLVLGRATIIGASQNCTIFTLETGDSVFYANNEDWHTEDLIVGFYPKSDDGYGAVRFGYYGPSGQAQYQGAINDQGLVWDVNSVPESSLTPHPERLFSHEEDNFFSMIIKQAATVEEAVAISKKFDFGDSMKFQIHIADATGDAVVIGPGPDRELAYTYKSLGEGYLISTNFNLADSSKGTPGWRYETATEAVEQLLSSDSVTAHQVGEVLDAVSLNNLTTFTIYSNVCDLPAGRIGLCYKSQFNEMAIIELEEELSKGQRIVKMSTLFSEETVARGDAAYNRFEWRFRLVQAGAVLVFLAFWGVVIVRIVKRFGKREKRQRGL